MVRKDTGYRLANGFSGRSFLCSWALRSVSCYSNIEFNNHNDRSEVRKARLYNEGFAIRSSESTGKRYFYSASNIGGYIYRSALPYDPYVRGILTVNKDFIYFMALMTLIFFFVLSRFTFSIGKTISKLRDFALNVEKDRMPAVDYVFPNDELGDISQKIGTV